VRHVEDVLVQSLSGVFLGLCLVAYPAASPAIDLDFHLPFEKYKLPNGLRVILSRDTTVPVAAVYVIYDVGSRTEEKGRAGFALLCERLAAEASHDSVERKGAVHPDYTEFYGAMPSNELGLALWLESNRMRGLALNDEKLKSAKEAMRQEAHSYDGQPYRKAILEQWPSLIFVHNDSNADDVNAAAAGDVAKFFNTYYAPNNAVLVISGDFAIAEAKKMVEQYFAGISSQPQTPRPHSVEPPRAAGKTVTVHDENARVPAVIVGWPAPKRHSAEWYALDMLDALLTGGRGSRLERELMIGRQSVLQIESNLGWPSSEPMDFKEPGYYAAMLIHTPIFSAQDIVDQYQQVIDVIAATGVDSLELKRAKALLRLNKASSLQTALDRARPLGIFELLDGDPGLVDRDFAARLAVTSDQIQAAAKKYLTAARRDVMIIAVAPPAGAKK
jgi:predicted Zn-dependent peptidase